MEEGFQHQIVNKPAYMKKKKANVTVKLLIKIFEYVGVIKVR